MKEFRIEILKGNDAGSQFRITGSRVMLGRATDSDIVITDQSVSRTHAELIKLEGGFLIKDLKSSNGVFVNGKKISEHFLSSGDVFTIGNHAYRFMEVEPVPERIRVSQVPEGTIPGISYSRSSRQINVPGSGAGSPNKKRLIMYGGVGFIFFALIILLLATEPPSEQERTIPAVVGTQDIEIADDFFEDEEVFMARVPEDMRDFYIKANEYYFVGRRELRSENYVRAMEAFRRALTFYPRHQRANYYIRYLDKKIKEQSERHLIIGKRMLEQKRYDDAIRSFNEVMNLNLREQGSRHFKEAERLRSVAERMRGAIIE